MNMFDGNDDLLRSDGYYDENLDDDTVSLIDSFDDMRPSTDEEMELYEEMLDKTSDDTDLNVFDLIGDDDNRYNDTEDD